MQHGSPSFAAIWIDHWPDERQATLAWLRCNWWNFRLMTQALDTEMERSAVRAARQQFAAALEKHGLMAPFYSLDAGVIDDLISAAVIGFQTSMQQQSAIEEIPF